MPSPRLLLITNMRTFIGDIFSECEKSGEGPLYIPQPQLYNKASDIAQDAYVIYVHVVNQPETWSTTYAVGAAAAGYLFTMQRFCRTPVLLKDEVVKRLFDTYIAAVDREIVRRFAPLDNSTGDCSSTEWFRNLVADILDKYRRYRSLRCIYRVREHYEDYNCRETHLPDFLKTKTELAFFLCHVYNKINEGTKETCLVSPYNQSIAVIKSLCKYLEFTEPFFNFAHYLVTKFHKEHVHHQGYFQCNYYLIAIACLDLAARLSGDPDAGYSPADVIFWGQGQFTIEDVLRIQQEAEMTGMRSGVTQVRLTADRYGTRAQRSRRRKDVVADPRYFTVSSFNAWSFFSPDTGEFTPPVVIQSGDQEATADGEQEQ